MTSWLDADAPRLGIRLRLLTEAEGGRPRPVLSGYRPHWDFGALYEGQPMQSSARVELGPLTELAPGDVADVLLYPAFPEFWLDVAVGAEINAYEGPRRVASAVVIDTSAMSK